jgi:selenocysteine lyase/cysteine desulfurase
VDFIASLAPVPAATRRETLVTAMTAVEAYEDRLRERLETALAAMPGVTLHSRAAHRTATLLATFDGRDAADAYEFLARAGVNAPAGSFYAIEPSRHLGLGDDGGLRAGIAPYTDEADVDRLVAGLEAFLRG